MSLTIRNLTKSFDKKTLFRDFTHSFEQKGIYAVTGDSGAGKTTLLRIIAGLDKNYSGIVRGGGAFRVSYCFQEHRLFPALSAFDNVFKVSFKEQNKENKKRTLDILHRMNFSDADMLLKPDELSGGMRQRVAFARAILKKSDILLLDEATKELDSELTNTVLEIISEESQKRLVIFVTHKAEEIKKLNAKTIKINP